MPVSARCRAEERFAHVSPRHARLSAGSEPTAAVSPQPPHPSGLRWHALIDAPGQTNLACPLIQPRRLSRARTLRQRWQRPPSTETTHTRPARRAGQMSSRSRWVRQAEGEPFPDRTERLSLSAPRGAMAWAEKRQSGRRSYVGSSQSGAKAATGQREMFFRAYGVFRALSMALD